MNRTAYVVGHFDYYGKLRLHVTVTTNGPEKAKQLFTVASGGHGGSSTSTVIISRPETEAQRLINTVEKFRAPNVIVLRKNCISAAESYLRDLTCGLTIAAIRDFLNSKAERVESEAERHLTLARDIREVAAKTF